MKVNRTYCLDLDIVEKLKEEDNASELINKLLFEHYKENSMTEEQIIQSVKDKIKNREKTEIEEKKKEEAFLEAKGKLENFSNYLKNMTEEEKEQAKKEIKEGKYLDLKDYVSKNGLQS